MNSPTSAEIIVHGYGLMDVDVDCPDEEYSYAEGSGVIVLPNIETDGDCGHDQLKENGVTLKSVTYDESKDQITVDANFEGVVSVTIPMDHASNAADLARLMNAPIIGESPAGTYYGKIKKLGETVEATVIMNSPTSAEIIVHGYGLMDVDVDCPDEEYSYAEGSGVIVLPNIETDGDCGHDQLKENGVTLKSVTYDESKDQITVDANFEGVVSVTIPMDHASNAADLARLMNAPLEQGGGTGSTFQEKFIMATVEKKKEVE